MNWQLFFKVNAMVNQLAFMLMDGKITADEAKQLMQLGLQLAGVELSAGDYFTFVETDGDLHLILKKALLDKLKFQI